MRMVLAALITLGSAAARADEFVTPSPAPAEVARFVVARNGPLTVKLDSMTGVSWYLCPPPKGKPRMSWCKFRDVQGLASGPVGRYRLVEGAPLLLVDSVSGRTWTRCEVPTTEKGEAWCSIDE